MALVRAIPLKNFLTNPLSTTDVSTGYQLGGLTTGQQAYGALHLTVPSTDITRLLSMVIQSATASG